MTSKKKLLNLNFENFFSGEVVAKGILILRYPRKSIKNLKSIFKNGSKFLIDRGDLSKEVGIENIPFIQRKILKLANKKNKEVFIATNFLESMINKKFPTRAEVNDIYNAIELGASGVVLAAETAIGNYPIECIKLLKKIFKNFKKL